MTPITSPHHRRPLIQAKKAASEERRRERERVRFRQPSPFQASFHLSYAPQSGRFGFPNERHAQFRVPGSLLLQEAGAVR